MKQLKLIKCNMNIWLRLLTDIWQRLRLKYLRISKILLKCKRLTTWLERRLCISILELTRLLYWSMIRAILKTSLGRAFSPTYLGLETFIETWNAFELIWKLREFSLDSSKSVKNVYFEHTRLMEKLKNRIKKMTSWLMLL